LYADQMTCASTICYISTQLNMERTPMESEKTLLAISVPEAGRRLGIGSSAAYAAAASGQLPVVRIGGLLRVPLAALERKLGAVAEKSEDSA
jgi:excisionase family DNA binding protein